MRLGDAVQQQQRRTATPAASVDRRPGDGDVEFGEAIEHGPSLLVAGAEADGQPAAARPSFAARPTDPPLSTVDIAQAWRPPPILVRIRTVDGDWRMISPRKCRPADVTTTTGRRGGIRRPDVRRERCNKPIRAWPGRTDRPGA